MRQTVTGSRQIASVLTGDGRSVTVCGPVMMSGSVLVSGSVMVSRPLVVPRPRARSRPGPHRPVPHPRPYRLQSTGTTSCLSPRSLHTAHGLPGTPGPWSVPMVMAPWAPAGAWTPSPTIAAS